MGLCNTSLSGTAKAPPLALVVLTGDFECVHYALVLAAAALAIGRRVTLFFTMGAVHGLLAGTDARPGWHDLSGTPPPPVRDAALIARGVAGYAELLDACIELGATIMVCEMGLRALGMEDARLRPGVSRTPGGAVTFLNATADAQILFV